eukprot:7381076-Prymnesium_polylepis.1
MGSASKVPTLIVVSRLAPQRRRSVALFSTLCVLSILPSVARVFLHACVSGCRRAFVLHVPLGGHKACVSCASLPSSSLIARCQRSAGVRPYAARSGALLLRLIDSIRFLLPTAGGTAQAPSLPPLGFGAAGLH